ncbi:MAG: hypothetical protein LBB94_09345 [Clostridiales bacterium]|jgi:hypothetical protein|nr:hypothetical protein [Clostridiales bacterium]
MTKTKLLLLSAAAILLTSLLGGISYAWFSARDEAQANRSDNGTTGGIAAGWLDVKLEVEAYLTDPNGVKIAGASPAGESPLLAYPGRTVYHDGDTLKTGDAKSVLKYTVTNRSKTDALARVDHAGVNLDGSGAEGQQAIDSSKAVWDSSSDTFLVSNLKVDLYKLLGSEIDYAELIGAYAVKQNRRSADAPYSSLDDFYANGPTWFYFASGFGPHYDAAATPAPDPWIYVNYDKLSDANFFGDMGNNADNPPNLYNVGATADSYIKGREAVNEPGGSAFEANPWAGGAPYPAMPFYRETPEVVDLAADSTVANSIKLTVKISPSEGAKTIDYLDYIYMYLPAGGSITYEYSLEADSDKQTDGPADMDNSFQFAVYKMRISDTFNTDRTLHAWGVEPVKEAVDYLFGSGDTDNTPGSGVWNALTSEGGELIPTPAP